MLLAASVPRVLMLLFSGVISDMLGPRYVMLRSTAMRVVIPVFVRLIVGGAGVASGILAMAVLHTDPRCIRLF